MKLLQRLTVEEVNAVVRDIHSSIEAKFSNLHGERIQGSGQAVSPFDLVTKFELDEAVKGLRGEVGIGATGSRTALGVDEYGDFLITGNYKFRSGTANIGTVDHAITAARTWTLPDATGNLVYQASALTADKIVLGDGAAKVKPSTLSAASGVYTPTLTSVASVTASTAYECQYIRIGDNVVVSGAIEIDPAAPTVLTQLGISLPIASNLANAEDCAGTANGLRSDYAYFGAISGDTANDRAQLSFTPTLDGGNQPMYFSFMYQVI